jgi:ribose 5-phosphate isomerase B
MEILIASDHAAFEAKELVKSSLIKSGHSILDLGPETDDRCDYPEFAIKLAGEIQADSTKLGVLLCGSGVGVSMVANRFKGVRAALCHNVDQAVLSKEHNNSNVLCAGGRVISADEIHQMVEAWIGSKFQEGRHSGRVALFDQLGEGE